jgi:hypothetical protein
MVHVTGTVQVGEERQCLCLLYTGCQFEALINDSFAKPEELTKEFVELKPISSTVQKCQMEE